MKRKQLLDKIIKRVGGRVEGILCIAKRQSRAQEPEEDFSGHEKDDVISYVSALANMEGGHLVVGVEDKTLKIVGTDTYNYDVQKVRSSGYMFQAHLIKISYG